MSISAFPLEAIVIYAVMSLATFIIYAWDKSSARKGRWRTPESTLHLLSLLGGWPGALVAQRLLRHKTAKTQFLVVFWLSVAGNCATLGWFLMSSASPLTN